MRALLFLSLAAASACAAPAVNAPSLAPRAVEAIDPRVPVPEPVQSAEADPGLAARLNSLVAEAEAGDLAFRAAIGDARRLAAAAGPPESESWVVAQQALSAAIAARAPVTRAMGEIDSIASRRVLAIGGIEAANLKAIEAAAARVAQIDSSQALVITEIQARLRS